MYFVEGVSKLEAFDGFGVWKILFENFVHGFEKRILNYILLVCIFLQTRKFSCDLPLTIFLFVLSNIYIPQLFLSSLTKPLEHLGSDKKDTIRAWYSWRRSMRKYD